MGLKANQSLRWSKKRRKARKAEDKPRKKRRVEVAPRKKRETKFTPIPRKGDIKGLAKVRKTCSPVLLRKRLLEFSADELSQYAAAAKVTLKTARMDRGPKPHPGEKSEDDLDKVFEIWERMVARYKKELERPSEPCTIAALGEKVLDELGLVMSKSALHRAQRGLKKPFVGRRATPNDPRMNKRNHNRI